VVGDSLYTVEPGEGGGWPAFDGVVAQFDPDEDGRITIAHASDDPIWARSFTGMDRHIGNGDGILTREEYAIASNEMMRGGLARVRLGGEGDQGSSAIAWRHTKGMPSLHDPGEQIIATPALADGRVYVRTEATLHCFAVDRTDS